MRRPARRPVVDALRGLPSDQGWRWLAISGAVGLLVFLVGPLVAVSQERQPTLDELALFGCLAVFVALYLWVIPSDLAGRPGTPPARATVLLGMLSVVIALAQPSIDWTVLFIITGTAAGRIPSTRAAAAAIGSLAVLATLVLLAANAVLIDALESGFEVILAGFVVLGFSQLERTLRELRRAQAHLAQLAVADERLRIARDMHDLLGHSLSVIALKVDGPAAK